MSGAAIIRELLANDATLTGQVPESRIKIGSLPLGTQLPAIVVVPVDSIPRNTVAMTEANPLHSDRVQVAVHIREVDDGFHTLAALLKLVLAACPDTKGTVATFACDSVLPSLEGPYLPYGNGFAEQSRDFFVRWT